MPNVAACDPPARHLPSSTTPPPLQLGKPRASLSTGRRAGRALTSGDNSGRAQPVRPPDCVRRLQLSPVLNGSDGWVAKPRFNLHQAEDAALGMCMFLHDIGLTADEGHIFQWVEDVADNPRQQNRGRGAAAMDCATVISVHKLKDPFVQRHWWRHCDERLLRTAPRSTTVSRWEY